MISGHANSDASLSATAAVALSRRATSLAGQDRFPSSLNLESRFYGEEVAEAQKGENSKMKDEIKPINQLPSR